MELDRNALHESRKAVAQGIADNLTRYGDLGNPISGDGTHGTASHIVRMGNANYLRYLAYTAKQGDIGNQHFLSKHDMEKEGLSAVPGTKPIIIERWTIDAKKQYHVFDLPLYPVSHMEGPESALSPYYSPEYPSKRYPVPKTVLAKLFLEAGVLEEGKREDTEALYHAARAYAKKRSPENPLQQACLTHLLVQEASLSPDYHREPLLDAAGIQKIQHDPDSLFTAFSHASKEMQEIREELRFAKRRLEQEQTAERARLDEAYKGKPFEGLRVTYFYSESPKDFIDREGNPIPFNQEYGTELRGEDAYRFLMQVNLADKKHFPKTSYQETEFAISYKDTSLGGHTYDLGTLELGNKKTVAEAMEQATTKTIRSFLHEEERLTGHLKTIQQYGSAEEKTQPQYQSKEAYQEYLRARLQTIQNIWSAFKKEEQAYLQEHPEYDKINTEDAHPYIAICKEADLEKMQERGIVSEVLPKDALHDFVTFTPGPSETQYALYAAAGGEKADLAKAKNASGLCYAEQEKLAPGLVAFVTPVRPDNARAWLEFHLANGEFPKKVLYAIPKETIKEIQSLQSIRLECTSYIPTQELATNAHVEVLQGIKAIQAFRIHVRRDDEAMKDAIESHTYLPGKVAKKELALFLGDKPIFQLT